MRSVFFVKSWLCLFSAVLVAPAWGAQPEFVFSAAPIDCGDRGNRTCVVDVQPYSDGHLLNGFVTTDADLVSLDNVTITIEPAHPSLGLGQFAGPFGSNITPPPPPLLAIFDSLAFDSWVTTPGSTEAVGIDNGVLPNEQFEGQPNTFFDDSDDGPLNGFHFTRLTFPPGSGGTIAGEIVLAGSGGSERYPFSFTLVVPEPSSLLLICVGTVLLANPIRITQAR